MKIEVDFKSIAVEKSHQPAQPVIYIVGPKSVHRRDISFEAFTNRMDAVEAKGSGEHIMEIILKTGRPRRTISQMHPAEVRRMKEEADANNEHFRKNHK